MRGLSLFQPWASLIQLGVKKVETRSMRVSYRGEIAIHATKDRLTVDEIRGLCKEEPAILDVLSAAPWRYLTRLPRGAIVAVARLVGCEPTETFDPGPEAPFGNFYPGRFAWILEDVRALSEPVPCKGKQSLWLVDGEVESRVRELLA